MSYSTRGTQLNVPLALPVFTTPGLSKPDVPSDNGALRNVPCHTSSAARSRRTPILTQGRLPSHLSGQALQTPGSYGCCRAQLPDANRTGKAHPEPTGHWKHLYHRCFITIPATRVLTPCLHRGCGRSQKPGGSQSKLLPPTVTLICPMAQPHSGGGGKIRPPRRPSTSTSFLYACTFHF